METYNNYKMNQNETTQITLLDHQLYLHIALHVSRLFYKQKTENMNMRFKIKVTEHTNYT